MYSKILVGLDGSEGSWKALRSALALARESHAEVCALSIEERLPHMPEVIDEYSEERERQNAIFERLHQQALALAIEEAVNLKADKIIGHAAQGIVKYAERGEFDLLVIGHSGHSGVWGTFLGSTADKIVRHAPCDVLVVR